MNRRVWISGKIALFWKQWKMTMSRSIKLALISLLLLIGISEAPSGNSRQVAMQIRSPYITVEPRWQRQRINPRLAKIKCDTARLHDEDGSPEPEPGATLTCQSDDRELSFTSQTSPTKTNQLRMTEKPPVISHRGAICYASASGSDASDGLSWATAKESLMACYDSMTAEAGTILFSDGGTYSGSQVRACPRSDPAGCGIWIMGPKDPNYKNPPPGWRRAKRGINFVGVAGASFGANTRSGTKPGVLAGNGADRNHPSIWLSAVTNVVVRNAATFSTDGASPLRGVVVGETSNHDRRGVGSCTSITLDNVDPGMYGGTGAGPGIDITGGSFWITIDNSLVTGAYGQPVGSDRRASILIDGGGNEGNGLVFITNTNVNGGGVKYVPGINPGSLVVRNLTMEGDFQHDVPPAVWISGSGTANGTTIFADNVVVADPGRAGAPALQVDGGLADNCTAIGVSGEGNPADGVNVRGPCTIVGQFQSYNLAASNDVISPLRRGQAGTVMGHVLGQHDSARRAFAPTAVRFTNLASQQSAKWATSQFGGVTTFRSQITAPDGTTNTGQASNRGSGLQENLWFTGGNGHFTQEISLGDWYVMGAWVRSATKNGYAGSNTQALVFSIDDAPPGSLSGTRSSAPSKGDGEWEWQWAAYKITKVNAPKVYVQFAARFDNAHSIEAYAPILLHIPTGTISDNEAYELAVNLESFPDTAQVGDLSTLRNQRMSIGGTTSFFAKLTHSCTADCIQEFPNASGPNKLAATNVTQDWERAQHFRAGSVFGNGTSLSRYARYDAKLSPLSVAARSCAAQAFSIRGVLAQDLLIAVAKPTEDKGLSITPGHVTGNNTATINFCNFTDNVIIPTANEVYQFIFVQ